MIPAWGFRKPLTRRSCHCVFPPAHRGQIWCCECNYFWRFRYSWPRHSSLWVPVLRWRAHRELARRLSKSLDVQVRMGFRQAFSLRHLNPFQCSNPLCSDTHEVH